jgi:hypothetical protein
MVGGYSDHTFLGSGGSRRSKYLVNRPNRRNWELVRTMIKFGEWLPDQPAFMNAGVVTAENVIPAYNGYRPLNQFISFSNAASGTIRGIYAAKDNAGNVKLFAGDDAKLYSFNPSTNNLDDVSKAGSPAYDLTGAEKWKFVQFGEYVIASGGIGEELQKWQLGTDTAFSNLGGSPPKADFLAVVRDFVWTANIDEGSGRIPYKARWSAFNDIEGWTNGVDQSDFQILPDSGAAIFRATYTGPPLIWQFDKVESQRGCSIPGSVCNYGSNVFYYSDNGFHLFDGQKSTPIGNEKIDKFFAKDFNPAYKNKMTAAVDPLNQIAVWSYTSVASTTGRPDRLLIFNYALGRWSIGNVDADFIAPFFSAGYTVEDLDNLSATLDGLSTVLDSQLFRGGEFFFGGAVGEKLFTFTGDPLQATITTGEATLSMGKHSIVTRVYPYHENGSVELFVGLRGTPTDTVAFSVGGTTNASGFVPFRAADRYQRVKMLLSGNWSFAHGIDVEAREVGRR